MTFDWAPSGLAPDTSALAWKMLGGVNSITRISPLNVIIARADLGGDDDCNGQ